MKHTAGRWDPKRRGIYFVGGALSGTMDAARIGYPHVLVAANELRSESARSDFEWLVDNAEDVIIDSGIFALASDHARKHGMSLRQAIGLHPTEVDGFDRLLDDYCAIAERFGDRVWGYMELDQGGKERKIETRAMLEARGLAPIPVYHPFNDGWDYFDQLAREYDRICLGNLVTADPRTRTKVLHTMWERHRDYPDLFVHILGLTPSTYSVSFPFDSADSSSWRQNLRWYEGRVIRTCGKPIGSWPRDFAYKVSKLYDEDEERGDEGDQVKAMQLGAAAEWFGNKSFEWHRDVCNLPNGGYPKRKLETDKVR